MKTLKIGVAIGCAAAALYALSGSVAAQAQEAVGNPGGYHVGEDPAPPSDGASSDGRKDPGSDTAGEGPVRLARFSYVSGDITWRPADSEDWSLASVNLPVRQGAQFWVNGNDRAELQFDDGSYVRLGAGAVVTLQTLYSDSHGEFTELRLSQGLITMHLINRASTFQIDTPDASIKAAGRSKVRIGVDAGTEVTVRYGRATVEDDQDQTTLRAGDYVNISDPSVSFEVGALPRKDSWDRFNDERDQIMSRSSAHLSPQLALCAGDLDSYGSWRDDSTYGTVWVPTSVQSGWRPYHDGHWVWVEPFGWTWVSDEPWGWAPYHYGTWFHAAYGWAWCPGPQVQYWSPAVVHFVSYGDDVCWAPLCPSEVRYPSPFDCYGTGGTGWWSTYSIGACAVYTPIDNRYCAPCRWRNDNVNRTRYSVNNIGRITSPIGAIHFVPQNCRSGYGASEVRRVDFGRRGNYQAVPATSAAGLFSRGRPIVAGQSGAQPIAGPVTVRPAPGSYRPRATVVQDTATRRTVFERPVLRTQVPTNISRTSAPVTGVIRPVRPVVDGAGGRPQPAGGGWNTGRPNGGGQQQGNIGNRPNPPTARPDGDTGNGWGTPRPRPKRDPDTGQGGKTQSIWGRTREGQQNTDRQPGVERSGAIRADDPGQNNNGGRVFGRPSNPGRPDQTAPNRQGGWNARPADPPARPADPPAQPVYTPPAPQPEPAPLPAPVRTEPVWTAPQREEPRHEEPKHEEAPAPRPEPAPRQRDPDPQPERNNRPEPARNDDQPERSNQDEGRRGGGVFGRPR